MKSLPLLLSSLLFTLACVGQSPSTSSLITTGATLQQVGSEFLFTEGPATDAQGNVYFTDQPNDRIWKYTFGKGMELFKEGTGRSNGLFIDQNGYIIACADADNQLWRIYPDGKIDTLLTHFDNKAFNGPNDVWISPTGVFYFTDPYYQRDYWTRKQPELAHEGVYRLDKEGKLHLEDADFKRPNGIVGTKDGKTLYVADINDRTIYRYRIQSNGTLSEKTAFYKQGSDGMTLDEKGNLYLTDNKGVTIVDPNGHWIETISIPENWTANVCFAGPERNILVITAMKSVYTLQMKVKGQFPY
jgi:gluconolactonase